MLLFPIYPNSNANVKRWGFRARAAGQGRASWLMAQGSGLQGRASGLRAQGRASGQGRARAAGHELQGKGCRAEPQGRAGHELQGEGRAAGQWQGRAMAGQGAKKHTNSLSWCVGVQIGKVTHAKRGMSTAFGSPVDASTITSGVALCPLMFAER